MEVVRAKGTRDVAALLRSFADEVERRSARVEGQRVPLSESLEAVIDLVDEGRDVTRIEVRLEHPTPAAWSLTELQQAMAHPGD